MQEIETIDLNECRDSAKSTTQKKKKKPKTIHHKQTHPMGPPTYVHA